MNSREIKFRVWDNIDKKIIYPANIAIYNNINKFGWYCSVNKLSGTQRDGNEGHILMQYTGLKDKNGKEIYDGDIISYISDDKWKVDYPHSFRIYGKGFVKWDTDNYARWIIDIIPETVTSLLGKQEADHSIIIGNIHQNPELLK